MTEFVLKLSPYDLGLLTALLDKYPTDAEKKTLAHVLTQLEELRPESKQRSSSVDNPPSGGEKA